MPDLDAAIRAKLAADDAGEPYWDIYRDAVEAVLDLHRAAIEDFTHIAETAYEAGRRWALEEAVAAIAEKLGVEE